MWLQYQTIKPTNKPLSDERWKLAWDSVHFGLYCQNRGELMLTQRCAYLSTTCMICKYNCITNSLQLY